VLPRGRERRRANGGGGGAPGAGRDVRGVHGGRGARAGGGAAAVRALVPRRLHRALAQDQDYLPDLPRGAAAAGGGGGRRPPAAARGVVHDARGHVAQLAQLFVIFIIEQCTAMRLGRIVQLQTFCFLFLFTEQCTAINRSSTVIRDPLSLAQLYNMHEALFQITTYF
jgi:hypothetical protein